MKNTTTIKRGYDSDEIPVTELTRLQGDLVRAEKLRSVTAGECADMLRPLLAASPSGELAVGEGGDVWVVSTTTDDYQTWYHIKQWRGGQVEPLHKFA